MSDEAVDIHTKIVSSKLELPNSANGDTLCNTVQYMYTVHCTVGQKTLPFVTGPDEVRFSQVLYIPNKVRTATQRETEGGGIKHGVYSRAL